METNTSFDNVSYYNETFAGDLIVTNGIIYFFPHTDLEIEREELRARYTGPSGHAGLLGIVGGVAVAQVHIWLRSATTATVNKPKIKSIGLWDGVATAGLLQSKLDAHVNTLKEKRAQGGNFKTTLPRPERFAIADVRNMSLGVFGTLKFEANLDTHDFNVGLRRKKTLRDALWMSGFLRN